MTWSYGGDPAASDKDAVRFEISDTDSAAPLLQDAEIEWSVLSETGLPAGTPTTISQGGLYSAAARCLESLQRRFAAQADVEVGDLKATYSTQAVTYAKRASELRVRAQGMHAPYAGGISRSDKQAAREDSDRVQGVFARGQFRNPATGPLAHPWPISDEQPP